MSADAATAREQGHVVGTVAAVRRYPVKSMLGEDLEAAVVVTGGVDRDRGLALIDPSSGRVATAKHPRLWRQLLQFRARVEEGVVVIDLPSGRTVRSDDLDVDPALSAAVGRPVRLTAVRPEGVTVERPAPEDVLAAGVDAEVPFEILEIAQGTSGSTFVDYAPVHLITSATLDRIGAEALRFRPNLVIDTSDVPPFAENGWIGREIFVGDVQLSAVLPTPRCAVPTLEHGDLPRAPHALRALLGENRVDVPGFGVLPCAGLYATVTTGGAISVGDRVVVR
jgi:uncharacterized protein YcbX